MSKEDYIYSSILDSYVYNGTTLVIAVCDQTSNKGSFYKSSEETILTRQNNEPSWCQFDFLKLLETKSLPIQ